MTSVTWQLIPLAVLSAITSPTAMAAVLVILKRPRPVRLLSAYVIGSFITSVLVGIALVAGFAATSLLSPHHRDASPILDISLGLLILMSSAWLNSERSAALRRRAAERRAQRRARKAASRGDTPSRTARVLSRGSTGAVAALGVVMHLPGLLYLAALGAIAHANVSFVHGLVLVVAFNIVMLAPIELPLLGSIVAPQRTEQMVERASAFVRVHTRDGLLGLSVLAGGYLIVSGIVGLVV
jgi:Sap, sulfolipid-1-addressing protein